MTLITVGIVLLAAWPAYTLMLFAYSVGNGVAARRHRRRVESAAPVSEQPDTFWIVVPCLNEERVVGRTVAAALALSGPAGSRTNVLVVDDGSDDATPDVLAGIGHPHLYVLRRDLPDARRGKGEALNAAYRCIRALTSGGDEDPARVAVGVIDGDGRGSDTMLTEVAYAMRDPRVGAVQSRVRIHNRDRLLAAVQDLEFGCVADASQSMRDSLSTVGLGGNGQFARLSALMRLGDAPWSACLVEDLELGLRMHLAGIRLRYLPYASVTQQGLVDVRRLLRQRTRWAQGNLECARYIPKLVASRRIGNTQLAEMLYYLVGPWLNAFGAVVIAAVWGLATWRLMPGHGPAFMVGSWRQLATAAGLWAAAMFAPGLGWSVAHRLKLRDEKLSRLLRAGLAYPFFLFIGLISTWRAIGRHVTRRRTWAKTERLAEEPVAVRSERHDHPIHPDQRPASPPVGTNPATARMEARADERAKDAPAPVVKASTSMAFIPRPRSRSALAKPSPSARQPLPEQSSLPREVSLPEVHLIAGTRPEAIKLAPVASAMRGGGRVTPVFVASGQHPMMVGQALKAFEQRPDVALTVNRTTGSQPELLNALVAALDTLFEERRPAAVVVQGDTTTALAGAMAAFWRQIPVVHLEAGLRSGDLDSPFPEEGNRRLIAQITTLHLAPTPLAASNLLAEGVPAARVLITGNTVVDAALAIVARNLPFDDFRIVDAVAAASAGRRRLVLVTAHRRESWGEPLDRILSAVRELVARYPDVQVVLPCHPNPAVQEQVSAAVGRLSRVTVTDPLPYPALAKVLSKAYLVLTDSGGIQEEAPSFGVPALVLRDVTERVESLRAGCAKLVGTDPERIVAEASALLDSRARRDAMTAAGNPYGDGLAGARTEEAVAALLGLADAVPPMTSAELFPATFVPSVGA